MYYKVKRYGREQRKYHHLDDERLKNLGGGSYWKELLDRIRDIRSSEKVLYRQVLDLYATAVDYDSRSETSRQFFKIVQNKLHYAAHRHTAAEVIYERADADKPFMGLTTFKGELPCLNDVKIAKNYLPEVEIRRLERAVSGYFDYIKDLIERENAFSMEQFAASVNEFLTFRRYALLPDKDTYNEIKQPNFGYYEHEKSAIINYHCPNSGCSQRLRTNYKPARSQGTSKQFPEGYPHRESSCFIANTAGCRNC